MIPCPTGYLPAAGRSGHASEPRACTPASLRFGSANSLAATTGRSIAGSTRTASPTWRISSSSPTPWVSPSRTSYSDVTRRSIGGELRRATTAARTRASGRPASSRHRPRAWTPVAGAQRDRRDGYVCVGGFLHSRSWMVAVLPPPDAESIGYVRVFWPDRNGWPHRSQIIGGSPMRAGVGLGCRGSALGRSSVRTSCGVRYTGVRLRGGCSLRRRGA